MLLLREVIFYIYGLVSAFEDIKHRSIGILPGGLAFAIGTILFFITGGKAADYLLSLIPGALILIMSVLSRGRIGLGDAMFISVSGVFMGMEKTVCIVIAAWFACAITGLFACLWRFASGGVKTMSLPFVTVFFLVMAADKAAGFFM